MKQSILILYLIFFFQELSSQNLIETYYGSCFQVVSTFEIFDDNTFIKKSITHSCTVDGDSLSNICTSEIKGTYKRQGNYLSLQPKSERYKPYNESLPMVFKNGIMNRGQFITDYYILEYKGTKHLIANMPQIYQASLGKRYNGFIVTANGLNERDSKDIIRGSSWQTKDCDYLGNWKNLNKRMGTPRSIRSHFPKLYKDYILSKPIESEVTQIREISFSDAGKEANPQWKRYLLTFNVGKKDGVKPDMIFYPDGVEGYHYKITIINVFENTCEGYVSNYNNKSKCLLESKNYSTKKWLDESNHKPFKWQ